MPPDYWQISSLLSFFFSLFLSFFFLFSFFLFHWGGGGTAPQPPSFDAPERRGRGGETWDSSLNFTVWNPIFYSREYFLFRQYFFSLTFKSAFWHLRVSRQKFANHVIDGSHSKTRRNKDSSWQISSATSRSPTAEWATEHNRVREVVSSLMVLDSHGFFAKDFRKFFGRCVSLRGPAAVLRGPAAASDALCCSCRCRYGSQVELVDAIARITYIHTGRLVSLAGIGAARWYIHCYIVSRRRWIELRVNLRRRESCPRKNLVRP